MRLPTWLVMLTVFALFLSLIGFSIPGLPDIPNALGITITNSTMTGVNYQDSGFWNNIFGDGLGILLLLVGGGAVVVGLFAKGYDPSLVVVPFIVYVGGVFISSIASVMIYVIALEQIWLTSIIGLIFGGLLVGFTMACIDYFRSG